MPVEGRRIEDPLCRGKRGVLGERLMAETALVVEDLH